MVFTKHSLDPAGIEESPKFLRAGQLFVCLLLLFGSCANDAQQPSGPVPGAAAVRVHHWPLRCSQDTCDWRLTGESPPPSTCNQHQRRRQYLGIQHVLPRTGAGWGRQVIKLSKSATNLTPCQYIELSESYVILTRKTKYVLRNLRSGGWSPFKTYIIVLGTPQCFFSFYSVTAIQTATAATPGH